MKTSFIKILFPLVFCLYVSAFLEIDFGTHVQTWNDENDIYTNITNSSDSNLHPLQFILLPDAVLSDVTGLFFDKEIKGVVITNLFRSVLVSRQIYLKDKAFLN